MVALPGTDAVHPGDERALEVLAAMRRDPLVVAPDEGVAEVVARMAERRHEAAIVVAGERVVGVFTATDAERMLAAMLRSPDQCASASASARAEPLGKRAR